jgi:NAD+ kinase
MTAGSRDLIRDADDAALGIERPAIRRIGFAYNPTKEDALELSTRATGWCAVRGIESWAIASADHAALVGALDGTDALVVLGGDGTFLRAARATAYVDVPLVGVNLGKVGFLSKAAAEDLEPLLAKLVEGRYRIEPRMALSGSIESVGANGAVDEAKDATGARPRRAFVALNDVVIARGSLARVVRLEVEIGPSRLATFVADGIVVSSPTGSTGYSFSAGGPILDPLSRNLVVTPIAAYLSAIRSVVVSPHQQVRCRIVEAFEALVSIDGREDFELSIGDVVTIRALERPIRFIEPEGSLPFWDLLRQKAQLLPS